MADNWANFGQAQAGNQQDGAAGDDDDDFGDFGGFEAAEPVAPHVAEAAAAPPIWAVMPGQNVGMQPDLIQAQPQPELASTINPPWPPRSTEQAGLDLLQAQNNFDSAARLNHSPEPAEPLAAAAEGTMPLDLAQGTQSCQSASHDANPELLLAQPAVNHVNELPPVQNGLLPENPPVADVSEQVQQLQEQLTAAETEKQRIQKDLADLLSLNTSLQQELDECKSELDQEKQRYQELQAKHENSLEEIRSAGHEALTVIVEEYKSLCKVAVLEQQEASETHLQEQLKVEAARCEELLQAQHERLSKVLEEKSTEQEEKIKEALEKQRLEQQEVLQKALEEERENSKEAINKALQEERDASQASIETAVQVERDKTRQLIEDEKAKMAKSLEEERSKGATALQEAIAEERLKSQEAIATAVEEERQKSKVAMDELTEKVQQDMKKYVQEQRQVDAKSRQRSLVSLDLFLESARQQLKLIIDQNQGRSTSENKSSGDS